MVEIGCGTARNLIRIAPTHTPAPSCSGSMPRRKCCRRRPRNVARAGLSNRITLVQGYAEALRPELFGRTTPFDHVLFPYSLSMIPDWRQALSAAGTRPFGKPGVCTWSTLAISRDWALSRRGILRPWLRLFHVEPRVEILAAIEAKTGRVLPPASGSTCAGAVCFSLDGGQEPGLERGVPRDVAVQSQQGGNSPS